MPNKGHRVSIEKTQLAARSNKGENVNVKTLVSCNENGNSVGRIKEATVALTTAVLP